MLTFALLLALYFLPTILAVHRGHRGAGLFVLNLLFGWTVLGWLILLFYVMTLSPRLYVVAPAAYPEAQYTQWQRF